MKTRMEMLPNGNYESVVSSIQHLCYSKDYIYQCVEYGWDLEKLYLEIEDGDPYEDGYSSKIKINYCPFCGYQPERSKREDYKVTTINSFECPKIEMPIDKDILTKYKWDSIDAVL